MSFISLPSPDVFFCTSIIDCRGVNIESKKSLKQGEDIADYCFKPWRRLFNGKKIELYDHKFVSQNEGIKESFLLKGLEIIKGIALFAPGCLFKFSVSVNYSIKERNNHFNRLLSEQNQEINQWDKILLIPKSFKQINDQSISALGSLPIEMIGELIPFLKSVEIFKLALTCKKMYQLTSQAYLMDNIPFCIRQVVSIDQIQAWPKFDSFKEQRHLVKSQKLNRRIQSFLKINLDQLLHETQDICLSEIKSQMTGPIQWGRDLKGRVFIAFKVSDYAAVGDRIFYFYKEQAQWQINSFDLPENIRTSLSHLVSTKFVDHKALECFRHLILKK